LLRTVAEELEKLRLLKEQSRFRKFAIQEDDKKQIAEIFKRINEARLRLGVFLSAIVLIPLLIASITGLVGDESQGLQDCVRNRGEHKGVWPCPFNRILCKLFDRKCS